MTSFGPLSIQTNTSQSAASSKRKIKPSKWRRLCKLSLALYSQNSKQKRLKLTNYCKKPAQILLKRIVYENETQREKQSSKRWRTGSKTTRRTLQRASSCSANTNKKRIHYVLRMSNWKKIWHGWPRKRRTASSQMTKPSKTYKVTLKSSEAWKNVCKRSRWKSKFSRAIWMKSLTKCVRASCRW